MSLREQLAARLYMLLGNRVAVLAAVFVVGFQAVLGAGEGGYSPCVYASCQCTWWANHFLPGPFGCAYLMTGNPDCWTHLARVCFWIPSEE